MACVDKSFRTQRQHHRWRHLLRCSSSLRWWPCRLRASLKRMVSWTSCTIHNVKYDIKWRMIVTSPIWSNNVNLFSWLSYCCSRFNDSSCSASYGSVSDYGSHISPCTSTHGRSSTHCDTHGSSRSTRCCPTSTSANPGVIYRVLWEFLSPKQVKKGGATHANLTSTKFCKLLLFRMWELLPT